MVAPAITYAQGLGYEGDTSIYANIAEWGAFLNNMLIAFFFVMGAIFFTVGWRQYVALAFVLVIAMTSHFFQFRVLTAITLAALAGIPGRKVAIGMVAGLIAIYLVGINFIPEVELRDPNDGLRLAFVSDVLTSVVDTHGIGIGYGKESVRWRYQFPNMPEFKFLPDPGSMTHARMLEALSTGVHNSFAQALLRTGVPGCSLLVVALFAAFPPRKLRRDVRNHASIMFAMIFIACFVNPALESPVQVVGIGFVYGYLIALRASVRAYTPQISWPGHSSIADHRPMFPRAEPILVAAK